MAGAIRWLDKQAYTDAQIQQIRAIHTALATAMGVDDKSIPTILAVKEDEGKVRAMSVPPVSKYEPTTWRVGSGRLSSVVEAVVRTICAYQLDRHERRFWNSGYPDEPIQLLASFLIEKLIELSAFPDCIAEEVLTRTTALLNFVKELIDGGMFLPEHEACGENESRLGLKSESITVFAVLLKVQAALEEKVIPQIQEDRANSASREHLRDLTNVMDRATNHLLLYLAHVLSGVQVPRDFTPSEYVNDSLLRFKALGSSVWGQFLLICSKSVVSPTADSRFSNPFLGMTGEPAYPEMGEVDKYFQAGQFGLHHVFSSDEVMQTDFLQLHAFVFEVLHAKRLFQALYELAGMGGDVFVYGFANGSLNALLSLCEMMMNKLHERYLAVHRSANQKFCDIYLSNKTTGHGVWLTNFRRARSYGDGLKADLTECLTQFALIRARANALSMRERLEEIERKYRQFQANFGVWGNRTARFLGAEFQLTDGAGVAIDMGAERSLSASDAVASRLRAMAKGAPRAGLFSKPSTIRFETLTTYLVQMLRSQQVTAEQRDNISQVDLQVVPKNIHVFFSVISLGKKQRYIACIYRRATSVMPACLIYIDPYQLCAKTSVFLPKGDYKSRRLYAALNFLNLDINYNLPDIIEVCDVLILGGIQSIDTAEQFVLLLQSVLQDIMVPLSVRERSIFARAPEPHQIEEPYAGFLRYLFGDNQARLSFSQQAEIFHFLRDWGFADLTERQQNAVYAEFKKEKIDIQGYPGEENKIRFVLSAAIRRQKYELRRWENLKLALRSTETQANMATIKKAIYNAGFPADLTGQLVICDRLYEKLLKRMSADLLVLFYEAGLELDAIQRDGKTLLQQAVEQASESPSDAHLKFLKTLLLCGANPNLKNKDGLSAFSIAFSAVKANHGERQDCLACLIRYTREPLEFSAMGVESDQSIIRVLLKEGYCSLVYDLIDSNQVSTRNLYDSGIVLKLLSQSVADKDLSENLYRLLVLILARGFDPNKSLATRGDFAHLNVMQAIANFDDHALAIKLALLFMEKSYFRFRLNKKVKTGVHQGRTALHIATLKGNQTLCDLLLRWEPDLDSVRSDNTSDRQAKASDLAAGLDMKPVPQQTIDTDSADQRAQEDRKAIEEFDRRAAAARAAPSV